jgi:hypothetical protein
MVSRVLYCCRIPRFVHRRCMNRLYTWFLVPGVPFGCVGVRVSFSAVSPVLFRSPASLGANIFAPRMRMQEARTRSAYLCSRCICVRTGCLLVLVPNTSVCVCVCVCLCVCGSGDKLIMASGCCSLCPVLQKGACWRRTCFLSDDPTDEESDILSSVVLVCLQSCVCVCVQGWVTSDLPPCACFPQKGAYWRWTCFVLFDDQMTRN